MKLAIIFFLALLFSVLVKGCSTEPQAEERGDVMSGWR